MITPPLSMQNADAKTPFSIWAQAQEIRKKMHALRNAQPLQEKNSASQKITQAVLSFPEIRAAKTVFIYRSFGGEVDTSALVSALTMQGKTVAFPSTRGQEMQAIVPKSGTFSRSPLGTEEPVDGTPLTQIDVSIIPALACDKNKNRLGFGKGYYDRFLAQNPCFKVAICYDFQLVSALPTHEKDVAMNAVVTPTRVYR